MKGATHRRLVMFIVVGSGMPVSVSMIGLFLRFHEIRNLYPRSLSPKFHKLFSKAALTVGTKTTAEPAYVTQTSVPKEL